MMARLEFFPFKEIFPNQWQPPLQFLQSQPHCRDFPCFLSRIILLTASMTPITTTVSTIAVPISHSPFHEMLKILFVSDETADTEEQLTVPPPQSFRFQMCLRLEGNQTDISSALPHRQIHTGIQWQTKTT